jgi:AraC family transcriptional regulator, regulatory protein of adaptative response / methylated-DNA-[protein]-cysteine methyltransferase
MNVGLIESVGGASPLENRWQAIVNRTPSADGTFLYGVKTTGIYCRPTCSSRQPNQANVVFFDNCTEAEAAGFRACKRCNPRFSTGEAPPTISPQQQQSEIIAKVCQQITESEQPLSLAAMAQIAGLSSHHFHRVFKEIVGVTPKQYVSTQRANRVRQQLQENNTITQAIYEAGFETSSSFYDKSTTLLGMTPTEYQQGAKGLEIQFAVKPIWLGWVVVAMTARGICAIGLGDTAEIVTAQLQQQFPHAQFQERNPEFDDWIDRTIAFIETPQLGLDLPLDIQGTAFQQRVWQALQSIPPGTTASYSEIAAQIGNPKAVRAVARACATNQIAVAIPCHRVVGSDGSLKGYRWGSDRKRTLIDREATQLPSK